MPSPGNANTVSVRIAPERSSPTCRPMIVVDRQHRVAHDVTPVDGARRQALGPRCANVILALDVEHGRARDTRDDRERDRRRAPPPDRIRCLTASQAAVPVAGDDAVEDVEVRRVAGVDPARPGGRRLVTSRAGPRRCTSGSARGRRSAPRCRPGRRRNPRVIPERAVMLRRQEADGDPEQEPR